MDADYSVSLFNKISGSDEINLFLVCNLGLLIFANKLKVSSDPTYFG